MLFRRKPYVIEAIQVLGTNDAKVKAFCPEVIDPPARDCRLIIKTLEGDMTAMPGDWIIKEATGKFSACKPDIFAATYEPVEESPVQPHRTDPIKWNPWNKVVLDHRDGTIHHDLTNAERAKRGLPVPWTPAMADTELLEPASP